MKIPTPNEQRQTYLIQLQPHVAEPILAIGFLTSAGYFDGLKSDYTVSKTIGMLVSPMMGRYARKQKIATRVAQSRNDLVAVTATCVHLFEFPKDRSAFVVSRPPDVWCRADITVTVGAQARYAQPMHVTFADGEEFDFDISRGGGDYATFSDAMRDLLLSPVSV